MTAGGTSTASDANLSLLQGGAHDPNQRGFTLQQGELSLTGAVDPYFRGAPPPPSRRRPRACASSACCPQ